MYVDARPSLGDNPYRGDGDAADWGGANCPAIYRRARVAVITANLTIPPAVCAAGITLGFTLLGVIALDVV